MWIESRTKQRCFGTVRDKVIGFKAKENSGNSRHVLRMGYDIYSANDGIFSKPVKILGLVKSRNRFVSLL